MPSAASGRRAVERFGKYVLITQKDLDRAERFFAGRGAWSVTIARLVPLLRAFAGAVSGLIEVQPCVRRVSPDRTVIWALRCHHRLRRRQRMGEVSHYMSWAATSWS